METLLSIILRPFIRAIAWIVGRPKLPPAKDFGTKDPEDERARDKRFVDGL